MFSSQLKPDSKPDEAPLRHAAYALLKPLKEESQRLQQEDIITLPSVDERVEWCNNFVLMPKT